MSEAIIDLSPYWRLVPLHRDLPVEGAPVIRVLPGAGWGDGRHPTTRLCLQALGFLLRSGFAPREVLDFGAGSGLLGVAAASQGARVEAVEIEEAGLAHARATARANGLEERMVFRREMAEPPRPFPLILANILRSVLMDYASALCERLDGAGRLVLSGLVATDVPGILARYRPLLPGWRHSVHRQGEWRALLFSPEGGTR